MKYVSVVNGREYVVEVDGGEATIGDEKLAVSLERVGSGNIYSLLVDGKSYEILADETMGGYVIMLDGVQMDVTVTDERALRLSKGSKAPERGGREVRITSPIPGMIVKVLVSEGDEVDENQPLAILEAMKMENEIRSPRKGTVKKVNVAPGDQVAQGELLIVIG
jgi:biotin carboxyl carrier protein